MRARKLDPRTPVIVGVGQLNMAGRSPIDPVREPTSLMAEAARVAQKDAGKPAVLDKITGITTVRTQSWRYHDPARRVASELGITPRHFATTTPGGERPQVAVSHAAREILKGNHDAVLVCGAEAIRYRKWAKREGIDVSWPKEVPGAPAPPTMELEVFGDPRDPTHRVEHRLNLTMPFQYYAIFENALRLRLGRSREAHAEVISNLWARFAEVAAGNPYAVIRTAPSAREIKTLGDGNPMQNDPYPRLMNANSSVDMASAVIVTSLEVADSLGINRDRLVFPIAAAYSNDEWFVSERWSLSQSPAIAANVQSVLNYSGLGTDDIQHFDFYSCFPSAVEVAASAAGLSLDDERGFTVTGGLTFAGGPGNNFTGHSLASMTTVLRESPGERGLVTGNGWFLTKHSAGTYSTTPPLRPFEFAHPREALELVPSRKVLSGEVPVTAELEGFTIGVPPGEPDRVALVCGTTGTGDRVWGRSTRPDLIAALESEAPPRELAFEDLQVQAV